MDLKNVTNIVVSIFMITIGTQKLDNIKEKTLFLFKQPQNGQC